MYSILRLSLACLFLFQALSMEAIADDKAPNPTKAVHRSKGPKPAARNSEGADLKSLDRPPEMPGISFPNAKFLYGFSTETKIGRNMGARFQVPDSAQGVINYYRTALKSTGWNVNEEGKIKPNQLSATNKQLKGAVTITTLQSPKSGCQVYFSYGLRN